MTTKTLYVDSRTKIKGTQAEFTVSLPEQMTLRGARVRVDNSHFPDSHGNEQICSFSVSYWLDGCLASAGSVHWNDVCRGAGSQDWSELHFLSK